jgi:dipeptidyl aminopeptidase/acylaminoacyl peptidase
MFQFFPQKYPWSLAVSCSIAMGGEISELEDALRPLVPLVDAGHGAAANEAWYQNWTKLGHRLVALADKDDAVGNRFTASAKYMRAANYYLFAERIAAWSDPRRMHVYGLGLEAFRKGIERSGARWERVEVPYEGAVLAGWLRLAEGPGKLPAMVFYNGFDSIKEMHYLIYADLAAQRGIATLFVDQEGTGEAVRYHRIAKRKDTELSAGKFYDALANHPAIDPDRIGIVGLSMGGYCAPRAAAMDGRFKCVASIGAFFELDADWEAILRGGTQTGLSDGLPESGIHAMHVTNTKTIDEAIAVLKSRTLEPVISRITCPLLVVHGENDRQVALSHARKTVAGAVNSRAAELRVFTLAEGATEHCGVDIMKMQGHYVYDWAARILGGKTG